MGVSPIDAVQQPYNNAEDSIFTRYTAKMWNYLAEPLAEHVFGPIEEKNHLLGVVAVNGALTAIRIPLEYKFSRLYDRSIEKNHKGLAYAAVIGKFITKAIDGLDGAVARKTNTQTEFGAGFDPAVDLYGSVEDNVLIQKQAEKSGDTLTRVLMISRLVLDGVVLAAGGVGNPVAQKYAEHKGVEFEEKDKAKANAMGKLKFGLTFLGDTLMLWGFVDPEKEFNKKCVRVGQAITAASLVAGSASVVGYVKAIRKKLKSAKEFALAA